MTRSNRPPGSGREPGTPDELGLPAAGPGSLSGLGRRLIALMVDWLLAYGIAALVMTLGWIPRSTLSTAVLVIWLVLGVMAVRLFQFTPGQLVAGLRVASVDGRQLVGLGRAVGRGVLIAFVVPALFVDNDGRGIQDRVTGTAVVRR